jgi:arylsulfatase A-like enzyme
MNTAVEWLEQNHDQGDFFLYIDTFDPHEPWDAPESYNKQYVDPGYRGEKVTYPLYFPASFYRPEEIRFMQGRYAAEANLVDTQVGKVLDAVQRLGLVEDTVVVFTSDHGYCLGDHGIVAKSIITSGAGSGARGYFESVPFYDEIAHIPLMIRMPGQQERIDHFGMVQSIDMMPTVLELAEVIRTEIVKGTAKVQTIQCGFYQEQDWSVDIGKLHGHSLVPIIKGEIENLRDFTVSSATLVSHSPREAKAAIRTPEWKLIYCGRKVADRYELQAPNFPPNREESDYVAGENKAMLFDLKNDPGEKHNVIEDHMDVAKDLHRRYVEHLVSKNTPADNLEKHREFVLTP